MIKDDWVEVERATEPQSFHCCPSSAVQRVLSQPPSVSLIGPEPDLLSMLIRLPVLLYKLVYSNLVSYKALHS